KKGIMIDQTERAFRFGRESGLRTLATVMIGNPTETMEDIEKTRELLRKIKPDFVQVTFTTPFPGAEIYDLAKSKGLITDDKVESGMDAHQLADPLSWSPVGKEELLKVYNEFSNWGVINSYLFNPSFLLSIAGFSILNPRIAGKIFFRLLRGNKKDAFQLFTETYM
ncbi:MAG: hypothetical protein NG740_05240, partial [Omnitrophica bacterium]|nr:hypothetical protein [Candidatus Omnitrophota bacterium]